jgi:hypothetical protein
MRSAAVESLEATLEEVPDEPRSAKRFGVRRQDRRFRRRAACVPPNEIEWQAQRVRCNEELAGRTDRTALHGREGAHDAAARRKPQRTSTEQPMIVSPTDMKPKVTKPSCQGRAL